MKNVVMISVYMILTALTVGILLTIFGREARASELSSNLSSVVEEAVENAVLAGNYGIEDNRAFLSDVMESLAVKTDTDSGLVLDVAEAAGEEGILAIETEARYRHLNGRDGSVKCMRAALFNRLMEEEEKTFPVCFFLQEEDLADGSGSYKVYTVTEGDTIPVPADPVMEGKTFGGWAAPDGSAPDFTQAVSAELSYFAVWN